MRKHTLYLVAVIIVGLSLLGVAAARAGEIAPDLRAALQTADPDDEIPVIITLSDRAKLKPLAKLARKLRRSAMLRALRQKAEATQAPLRAYLQSERAQRLRDLWIINGMAVKTTPRVIRRIAQRGEVASVRLDYAIPVGEASPQGATAGEWNTGMINADDLWAMGYTGSGVVVASMDTGVDPFHPDLSNYRGGGNSWYDPNGEHPTPYDANGHGTWSMGLMVGGDTGGATVGVAPGAQWIAVKIFNDMGQAPLSAIHLGFQWLLDPDGNPGTDDAPDVVNNSWVLENTVGQCDLEFAVDIDILRQAGIAVVFSAGNSGPSPDTSVSPSNNPGALAVGAVDYFGYVAYFSAGGPSACSGEPYPQLMAPGVSYSGYPQYSIRTTDLTLGGTYPNAYTTVTGTSFAAPQVSGALALLISAGTGASAAELEAALMQSAMDLGDPGPDNESGYGLVDVVAAYNALQSGGSCTDADGDQFFAEPGCGTDIDCNDNDDTVYPGAIEIPGDGIDQDCDGQDTPVCTDADSDGYYAESGCGTAQDCNDNAPAIYPGAPEIPDDGIDQDCDGSDLTQCMDADGDGYFAGPDCGTDVDCDDNDPTAHPGAAEIKHDGVDQDCNGYDLSIDIDRARYQASQDKLVVLATSDLGSQADLEVTIQLAAGGSINRAMTWNANRNRWQRTINGFSAKFGSQPVSVTVYGPEGAENAAID